MTRHAQHILKDALGLSPVDRAELIERLMTSFEFPSKPNTDAAWARESESRLEAHRKGRIRTVSFEKLFKNLGR